MIVESNQQPPSVKVALVLSAITYVPANCDLALQQVLKTHAHHLSGIIQLENLDTGILAKAVWLYSIGCHQTAHTLFQNTWRIITQRRRRLLTSHNLPLISAKSVNQPHVIEWLKHHRIDALINLRTRCIFRSEVLSAPRFGCFNLHHGLLPHYRGMYCDLYALYENRPAGISLHQMNRQIDAGRIIYTRQISSGKEKNYRDYLSKVGQAEADVIIRFIDYLSRYQKPPHGKINAHRHIVYTRTPSQTTIKQMHQAGLIL